MSRGKSERRAKPDAPLGQNACFILHQRVAKLYSYAPVLPDEQATTKLHEMRIAAKRLRYTLELFADVLGESAERQIGQVKAIQDALGLVHDADVRMALIERELIAVADEEIAAAKARTTFPLVEGDPRPGLLALLARQAASRRAEYEEFTALWTRLHEEGLHDDLIALSGSSPHPGR